MPGLLYASGDVSKKTVNYSIFRDDAKVLRNYTVNDLSRSEKLPMEEKDISRIESRNVQNDRKLQSPSKCLEGPPWSYTIPNVMQR